jgi:carbon storage regulator
MLVLSRKESESLIINENIIITIIRIAGGGVRIGIEAPREIPVRRKELVSLRDLATRAGAAAAAM